MNIKLFFISSVLLACAVNSHAALSLQQAETMALAEDITSRQLRAEASAYGLDARAADALPDPRVTLGALNFPVDSFAHDEQAMTQLRLGISQQFPRSGTLKLNQQLALEKAASVESMLGDHQQQLLRELRIQWFEMLYLKQAVAIEKEHANAFEQLVVTTRSLYEVGRKNQYDLVRSELALAESKNRLLLFEKRYSKAKALLKRWLGNVALNHVDEQVSLWFDQALSSPPATDLAEHPRLQMYERQVDQAGVERALAESALKPAWGLHLDYGYRDGRDFNGQERPDFLSARVTLDIPLFSRAQRNDRVRARQQSYKASLEHRNDVLLEMQVALDALYQTAHGLERSLSLYQSSLLDKSRSQLQAALSAYQSDAVALTEVIDARNRWLHTRMGYERTQADYRQSKAQLAYYLALTPEGASHE